jgi:hypothetical protein
MGARWKPETVRYALGTRLFAPLSPRCLRRILHAFDFRNPSQKKRGTYQVKRFESKLTEPLLLGLIESPMPIGTVWIPFLPRPFYNRFADLLAIRVSLNEEALVPS